MGNAEVSGHRMLATSEAVAAASLFVRGLFHTALLQLHCLDTGAGQAVSVYAVYREGGMTFEASAQLEVAVSPHSPRSILTDLLVDSQFLDDLFNPMVREVDKHFGRLRTPRATGPLF